MWSLQSWPSEDLGDLSEGGEPAKTPSGVRNNNRLVGFSAFSGREIKSTGQSPWLDFRCSRFREEKRSLSPFVKGLGFVRFDIDRRVPLVFGFNASGMK